MKTKYFLYARKSTEDEDRQIMSIEAQITELTEYANRENIIIAEKFIESKSAKKPVRKIFNQMIEKIYASKEPVGILAWHPDRLARNSVDGGQIIYLIDINKIVSLRFPTFWFEPTPQGMFMMQVAFGQSKYYSDNLSQNVQRGIRQKLRRGEWAGRAPFGYINNKKTRNIEPDPVKSRIVKKVFDEFATGKHNLETMRHQLAYWGFLSRNGKVFGKEMVKRILTNKVYIGLIVHNGETYQASFPPLISVKKFETVQKVLKSGSKPRKTKKYHNFPFTGLLKCGECGGAITAQFAKGNGGIYRYYRCSKRLGKCSQRYLRENNLVAQLKEKIINVSIPEIWLEKMFAKIDVWEKEQKETSASFLKKLDTSIKENKKQLDRLVNAFLDGTLDKEIYLVKKDELLRRKTALFEKKKEFKQKGQSWFEPLREFVKTAHRAEKLALSNDFEEIKSFIEKIGTNRQLLDRKLLFDFKKPFDLIPNFSSKKRFNRHFLSIVEDPAYAGENDRDCRLSRLRENSFVNSENSGIELDLMKSPKWSG